jgi:hypothetical protein
MMKKLAIIMVFSAAGGMMSCSDVQRTPGHVYMPDMAYSRAYETYADHIFLAAPFPVKKTCLSRLRKTIPVIPPITMQREK